MFLHQRWIIIKDNVITEREEYYKGLTGWKVKTKENPKSIPIKNNISIKTYKLESRVALYIVLQ